MAKPLLRKLFPAKGQVGAADGAADGTLAESSTLPALLEEMKNKPQGGTVEQVPTKEQVPTDDESDDSNDSTEHPPYWALLISFVRMLNKGNQLSRSSTHLERIKQTYKN